jgi:hypothetical protein
MASPAEPTKTPFFSKGTGLPGERLHFSEKTQELYQNRGIDVKNYL